MISSIEKGPVSRERLYFGNDVWVDKSFQVFEQYEDMGIPVLSTKSVDGMYRNSRVWNALNAFHIQK